MKKKQADADMRRSASMVGQTLGNLEIGSARDPWSRMVTFQSGMAGTDKETTSGHATSAAMPRIDSEALLARLWDDEDTSSGSADLSETPGTRRFSRTPSTTRS